MKIYNIIRWFAGLLGQMTRPPSMLRTYCSNIHTVVLMVMLDFDHDGLQSQQRQKLIGQ